MRGREIQPFGRNKSLRATVVVVVVLISLCCCCVFCLIWLTSGGRRATSFNARSSSCAIVNTQNHKFPAFQRHSSYISKTTNESHTPYSIVYFIYIRWFKRREIGRAVEREQVHRLWASGDRRGGVATPICNSIIYSRAYMRMCVCV